MSSENPAEPKRFTGWHLVKLSSEVHPFDRGEPLPEIDDSDARTEIALKLEQLVDAVRTWLKMPEVLQDKFSSPDQAGYVTLGVGELRRAIDRLFALHEAQGEFFVRGPYLRHVRVLNRMNADA